MLRWLNDPEITARLKYDLGVTLCQEEVDLRTDRDASEEEEFVWAVLDEGETHIGFTRPAPPSTGGIAWRPAGS